jgi:peptidoglycan/LPS O-acetylase OafA/YrhL
VTITTVKHADSPAIPSLDGWRAIAIIIVFLSHAGLGNLVPGGFGVTVFFFLSGLLITSLMIVERENAGTLSIGKFYLRRFLRLSPALLITLVGVYVLTYIGYFHGSATWRGISAQAFYFANYYEIFFDAVHSTPEGTGIFWSLAVEEHYYLIFPWMFLYLAVRRNQSRLIAALSFVCVAVLTWRCYLVFICHAPEYRTYYASDTRIDSIIFGAILALVKNPSTDVTPISANRMRIMLSLSVGLILLSLLYRAPEFRETFRYSVQGVALAPMFYYSIRAPRSVVFAALNSRVMMYVGRCSYSMYLIHFVLIENFKELTSYAPVNMALCFFLSILYASAIDKFVDRKFRALRARLK